jgi:hypothetical protein
MATVVTSGGDYLASPGGAVVRWDPADLLLLPGDVGFLGEPSQYDLFAAGLLPIAGVQAQAVASLTAQANATIDAAFNSQTRDMLNFLFAAAQTASPPLPNRAAYLAQVGQWGQQVYMALAQAIAAIQQATTPDAVNAVTLTLPSPPDVTLAGAMQIND